MLAGGRTIEELPPVTGCQTRRSNDAVVSTAAAVRLAGCGGSVSPDGVEDRRGLVVVSISETSSGRPDSS